MATPSPENTPITVLTDHRDGMSFADFPLSARISQIAADSRQDPAKLELLGAAVYREVARRRHLLTTATERGARR